MLAGLGCSLAAAVAFVAAETAHGQPDAAAVAVPPTRFVSPVTIGFLVNVCFYGLIFLFSLLFQAQHRMSALETGLAFLPMTAAILGANLISGRVNAAIGPSRAILVGLAAMTAGCAGLLWISPATGYPAMLAQQILLGGGLGTLVPPMTSVLLASAERSRSGVTSGALTAFRQAGSLLGVALFGSLRRHRFLRRLPYRPLDLRGYPDRQRGRGRRGGRDRTEAVTAMRPPADATGRPASAGRPVLASSAHGAGSRPSSGDLAGTSAGDGSDLAG